MKTGDIIGISIAVLIGAAVILNLVWISIVQIRARKKIRDGDLLCRLGEIKAAFDKYLLARELLVKIVRSGSSKLNRLYIRLAICELETEKCPEMIQRYFREALQYDPRTNYSTVTALMAKLNIAIDEPVYLLFLEAELQVLQQVLNQPDNLPMLNTCFVIRADSFLPYEHDSIINDKSKLLVGENVALKAELSCQERSASVKLSKVITSRGFDLDIYISGYTSRHSAQFGSKTGPHFPTLDARYMSGLNDEVIRTMVEAKLDDLRLTLSKEISRDLRNIVEEVHNFARKRCFYTELKRIHLHVECTLGIFWHVDIRKALDILTYRWTSHRWNHVLLSSCNISIDFESMKGSFFAFAKRLEKDCNLGDKDFDFQLVRL